MIEIVKDTQGRILAVCEYLIFDDDETVFVGEFYINPDQRMARIVEYMMRTLYERYPQAKFLEFLREHKYPGRKARRYTREQVKRKIGG